MKRPQEIVLLLKDSPYRVWFYPRKPVTLCEIWSGPKLVAYGMSRAKSRTLTIVVINDGVAETHTQEVGDQYDHIVGMKLALRSALSGTTVLIDDRRQMWDAFREQFPYGKETA